MQVGKLIRFLIQATTAGLAAAFVLLFFFPEWLDPDTVVEIKQDAARPGSAAGGLPHLGEGPVSYADAVAKAAPAVVNIYTAKRVTTPISPLFSDPFFRRFFGDSLATPRQRNETSLGSGVILSNQGYILTNNHLISGADEIRVLVQESRATTASVVGTDPETDLAVLKIDLPDLPTLGISDSHGLRVGDVVLAIGNPFGVGQTVTMGIVSATGRHRLGLSTFEDFIQTDAAINPGNSGGALIDARGRLVGINTAIFSPSGGSRGIGFAIPVDLVKEVMGAIIEHGYVARGWLGAEVQPLAQPLAILPGLAESGGIVVGGVVPGSPAEQAGLFPGDIITHINGEPIPTPRAAINFVASISPGTRISLTVIREDEMKTFEATVGERTGPKPVE